MDLHRRRFLGAGVVAGTAVMGMNRLSTETTVASSGWREGDEDGVRYVPPKAGIDGIQAAIDDGGPNTTVKLDRGTYVGSGLTLDDGSQLVGLGRRATTLKLADGADEDLVVTANPDAQSLQQIRLENLTLDGNNVANASGALVYGAFWNARMVDCDFLRAPETGVWLAGSSDASTDDNYLRGCRFIDGTGDALRQGRNRESSPAAGVARIESCWFGNNGGQGVRLRGNANVISNGKFYDNGGIDVVIDRGTRNRVVNNDLAKATKEAPCISIQAGAGVDSVANRIHGNVFDGSFRDAIHCRTDDNAIVGLQIHDSNVNATDPEATTSNGIHAEPGTYRGCSARNNTFVGAFENEPLSVPESWAQTGNVTSGVAE